MTQELLKTKIDFFERWMNWLSEDKFNWYSSCSCWDGLIYNFFKGTEGTQLGCLYNQKDVDKHKTELSELNQLGISTQEMIHFEFLVDFWNGSTSEHNSSIGYGYKDYQNGITYFKEYIQHLKSQLKEERKSAYSELIESHKQVTEGVDYKLTFETSKN